MLVTQKRKRQRDTERHEALSVAGLKILLVSRVIILEKNSFFFLTKCLSIHVSALTQPVSLSIYWQLWLVSVLTAVFLSLFFSVKDSETSYSVSLMPVSWFILI